MPGSQWRSWTHGFSIHGPYSTSGDTLHEPKGLEIRRRDGGLSGTSSDIPDIPSSPISYLGTYRISPSPLRIMRFLLPTQRHLQVSS